MFFFFVELNSTSSPLDDAAINNEEDVLYQKDAIFDAELNFPNYTDYYNSQLLVASTNSTEYGGGGSTQNREDPPKSIGDVAPSPPTIWQTSTASASFLVAATSQTPNASTARPCTTDCGPGGGCIIRGEDGEETASCLCPLGKGGERCEKG